MMRIFVPSDIIIRIFSLFRVGTKIDADVTSYYNFFYKKSQEERYKILFDRIDFDPSFQYTHSKMIDIAMNRMLSTGALIYTNVSSKTFEVSPVIKELLKSIKKSFPKEYESLVKDLHIEFCSLVIRK